MSAELLAFAAMTTFLAITPDHHAHALWSYSLSGLQQRQLVREIPDETKRAAAAIE